MDKFIQWIVEHCTKTFLKCLERVFGWMYINPQIIWEVIIKYVKLDGTQ